MIYDMIDASLFAVCRHSGLDTKQYCYYEPKTCGFDFKGAVDDISVRCAAHSVFIQEYVSSCLRIVCCCCCSCCCSCCCCSCSCLCTLHNAGTHRPDSMLRWGQLSKKFWGQLTGQEFLLWDNGAIVPTAKSSGGNAPKSPHRNFCYGAVVPTAKIYGGNVPKSSVQELLWCNFLKHYKTGQCFHVGVWFDHLSVNLNKLTNILCTVNILLSVLCLYFNYRYFPNST